MSAPAGNGELCFSSTLNVLFNIETLGKKNSLFPEGADIKCIISFLFCKNIHVHCCQLSGVYCMQESTQLLF